MPSMETNFFRLVCARGCGLFGRASLWQVLIELGATGVGNGWTMSDSIVGIPIISMWMPWSIWVALGWKGIESREHDRFRGLLGKRIGVHSTLKWDPDWSLSASPYLTYDQRMQTFNFSQHTFGGKVICTAEVINYRQLEPRDEQFTLIECRTKRMGLFLHDVRRIEPVPCKGRQGIFYLPAVAK